jgi:MYXO-CTERM domain-containing protein
MRPSRRLAPSLTLVLTFVSAGASAHISLDSPKSRYFDMQKMEADQNSPQKQAPCGMRGDKRTTNSALITTFKPGEQITVKWHETIGHPGHYRIAFLENGQDFPPGTTTPVASPTAPILADGIKDDSSKTNGTYSVQVTLPNVECTNCTLQLIQVMTDSGGYYYQCADLVLSNGASGGGAGSGGASSGGASSGGAGAGGTSTAGRGGGSGIPILGGSGGMGMAGGAASGAPSAGGSLSLGGTGMAVASGGSQGLVAGGAPPVAGTSNQERPAGGTGGASSSAGRAGATTAAGSPASAGAPAQPSSAEEDEGGCNVRGPRGAYPSAGLGLAALAWAIARRRKSRAR